MRFTAYASRANLCCVTCTVVLLCSIVLAAPPRAAFEVSTSPTSVNLRGYGTISAEMESPSAEGAKASVLRITCQTQAKAELVLAKYLSDLRALPGVTAGKLAVGGSRELPGWQVVGQGWILAVSADRTVVIVASEKPPAVRRAAEPAFVRAAVFTPSASVPAYLDKWDKHGWSFYNWLWYTPNAAGIRPLGKGYVINMGVVFGRQGSSLLMKKLLEDIVLWRGVKDPIPGQIYPAVIADPASLPKDLNIVPSSAYLLSAAGAAYQDAYSHDFDGSPWSYRNVLFRHFQSNNGLYDVWALFNQSPDESRTVDLTFRDGLDPAFGVEVRTGKKVAVAKEGGIPKIKGIRLQPLESRAFLTPRKDLSLSALQWFTLQRAWWRSCSKPGKPFPPVPHKFTVDLFDGWALKPLVGQTAGEIAALAGPGTDDTTWEHCPLGIWTTPKRQNVRHDLLRRWVEVSRNWDRGAVKLWLSAWYMGTFYDHGTLYLDGEKCPDYSSVYGQDVTAKFQPGSCHLVAIEVKSDGQLTGVTGNCWLCYTPEPLSHTSLAGKWTSSPDMIHYDSSISLPGQIAGKSVRRDDVTLDAAQKGKTVMLYVDSDTRILGAIVNGHWVSRFHHMLTPYLDVNVTPWIRFDKPNVIELTGFGNGRSPRHTRTVEVRYYERGEYP